MTAAALLALCVFTASPHITQDDLALLGRSIPLLTGPLASLGPPLEQARVHGAAPSVAAARDHLAAVRGLEEKARLALGGPLSAANRAALHLALGVAWAELANLEGALAIEGEGDGPERVAVRSQARTRGEDATLLAASELFDAASEPGATLPDSLRALGLRVGASLRQSASAGDVARSRASELQACWEEHLLTQGQEEPLALLATLELDAGRVTGVSFQPTLAKQRARLSACLTLRLLGWRVTDAADALELPLRLGATARPED